MRSLRVYRSCCRRSAIGSPKAIRRCCHGVAEPGGAAPADEAVVGVVAKGGSPGICGSCGIDGIVGNPGTGGSALGIENGGIGKDGDAGVSVSLSCGVRVGARVDGRLAALRSE